MVASHVWTSTATAEEIAPQAEDLRKRFEKYGGMEQTRVVDKNGTITVLKEKQPIWEMDKCKCDGGGRFLELGGTFWRPLIISLSYCHLTVLYISLKVGLTRLFVWICITFWIV
jgi:hypothetical protein